MPEPRDPLTVAQDAEGVILPHERHGGDSLLVDKVKVQLSVLLNEAFKNYEY